MDRKSDSKSFSGTGVLVWFADGQMKFRCLHDQNEMDKEVERLRQTVPNRCIFLMAINWDEQEVLTFTGKEPEVFS